MRRVVAIGSLLLALVVGAAVASTAVAGDAASSTSAASAAQSLPSAAQIDAYLAGKGSPMAGQGAAFLASGGRWQVDPRLLVAISGAESNFGTITCAPFNAWGFGCPNGPYEFTSWADGIDTVAQGLRTGYLAEGRTSVALINLKYAPIGAANDPTGLNNNWTINVSRFLIELGGDPNDVDIDHVAGTRLLGAALSASGGDAFGFSEVAAPRDAASTAPSATALEVTAGVPKPLTIDVKNTGLQTWTASSVRLTRVDDDARIAGDPFGSLSGSNSVAPGDTARFVVLLAARGANSGTAQTQWRLEGPSGPFGAVIERAVGFAIPALAATQPTVSVRAQDGGTNIVEVKVQNAGSGTWLRDGESRVLLGLRSAVGTQLQSLGWVNQHVPATLLERDVRPGEFGTFAFRVQGSDAALAVQPFTTDGWIAGGGAVVVIGTVADSVRTDLAASFAP